MYRAVPAQIDLTAMEHEVLALWEEKNTFARSLDQSQGRPTWVFYEGPPTANGTPGTHHVEARAFKDIFPRYRTMKGYHVPRQAGWDCHGLPVELAVEKELGFTGKQDIEKFGVAQFNDRCKESVLRHVGEFTEMTQRMGYWVDMDSAYWTMDSSYVQSVWWSLKQIFDKGLLVQDHRVAPYCPRCGTGLSDHELAQGYETVVDPSVFVRFPITDASFLAKYPTAALLVWTTTPWTLVSNTAVAVKPTATYVVVRTIDGETLVVAQELAAGLFEEGFEILATMPGTELERVTYQRPFDFVEIPDAHYVILADYVTTDDGTGLVHQAPAFGADDLASCRAYGLPVVNPVLPNGHFEDGVPVVGGMFFKKSDEELVKLLDKSGALFKHVQYEHSYPHCWRCHTPLIYYAQPSWYIRTTAIKDQLIAQNEKTNWFPGTIKNGRFGDWLENNVDWALSRNRYWGTPLPIWRCEDNHLTAVGSLAELSILAGHDVSETDPHRPYVDDITIACPTCNATATRVPEVIDCWYDSGAMPFAAVGYPQSDVDFAAQYPADFICEAIDQTRGWFYTLMAIGTLVFEESSYKNVVCLGHILDEDGRKMSKHVGNVLEPIGLMNDHGADAVRWFMLASGSPWQARRVGHAAIGDVVRKTLLTYWNTVAFQSLYGRLSDWDPTSPAPAIADRPIIDRWLLSDANRLARDVDAALDQFDTQRAGRLIATFIDDLSNWYVRRSRRRFWDGDPAALSTLHEALHTVTLCMAPFTPFITERVWQDLFSAGDAPDSVHLASWPIVDESVIDEKLSTDMALVRRIVELGRAARATSGVRTRQPLRRALVSAPGWADLSTQLRDQVCEELNILSSDALDADEAGLVDISMKANFRTLGARFAKQTPLVANAIAAANAAELHMLIRSAGSASLEAGELGTVSITAEDVVVTETPREGWAVASEAGESVALDLTITDELRRAGLAREVVRGVQEARKNAGFEISDRISLWWASDDAEVVQMWADHATEISGEVLATEVTHGAGGSVVVEVADVQGSIGITRN
ncbi:MAG: isoleucine--tRNA ligase [Actinobacteria bacterium]|uniref:isoleucine--tRNA ligase n=1 Tax=freshwater metagenome TaxID=449393 RepID=A0A6J7FA47_9ZZZZ|nr:isoleucine--tRNA ligase [Actinomycetota bacterium]MTB27388.1 isoleucine--tRNA ligase [Actinomycetota bacterium]